MTHPISHHHSRELTLNWKSLKKRSLIDVLIQKREREISLIRLYAFFFLEIILSKSTVFPLRSRCNFHAYVTWIIGWGPCGMKWRSLIRVSHSVPVGIKTFYNNNAYALEVKNLTQNFEVFH